MEKLKLVERFKLWKLVKGNVPKSLNDLEKFLKDLVIWLEDMWSEKVKRINWLLTNKVEDHTASDTLTEHESDSVHTNLGATGTITLTLPTVAKVGIVFTFAVQAAYEL